MARTNREEYTIYEETDRLKSDPSSPLESKVVQQNRPGTARRRGEGSRSSAPFPPSASAGSTPRSATRPSTAARPLRGT